jgi:RNA polymerase I-specific transcription initiation factor RRN6
VDYYCFPISTNAPGLGTSFRGSFTITSDSTNSEKCQLSFQTLCALLAPLARTSAPDSDRPEFQYLERDVRFFQIWALNTDLGLHSTLLSLHGSNSDDIIKPRLIVTAPTIKIIQPQRPQGPRVVQDSFIVMDGVDDERLSDQSDIFQNERGPQPNDLERGDLRLSLDWKLIFQQIFGLKGLQTGNLDEDIDLSEVGESRLQKSLDLASSRIREGIKGEMLTNSTLYVKLFLPASFWTNYLD